MPSWRSFASRWYVVPSARRIASAYAAIWPPRSVAGRRFARSIASRAARSRALSVLFGGEGSGVTVSRADLPPEVRNTIATMRPSNPTTPTISQGRGDPERAAAGAATVLGRGDAPAAGWRDDDDGRRSGPDWTFETRSLRSLSVRLARRSGTHFLQAVRVPKRRAFEASRSALVTRSWHLKQYRI